MKEKQNTSNTFNKTAQEQSAPILQALSNCTYVFNTYILNYPIKVNTGIHTNDTIQNLHSKFNK